MDDHLFYVFGIKLEKESTKETAKEKQKKKVDDLEPEDKVDAIIDGIKK